MSFININLKEISLGDCYVVILFEHKINGREGLSDKSSDFTPPYTCVWLFVVWYVWDLPISHHRWVSQRAEEKADPGGSPCVSFRVLSGTSSCYWGMSIIFLLVLVQFISKTFSKNILSDCTVNAITLVPLSLDHVKMGLTTLVLQCKGYTPIQNKHYILYSCAVLQCDVIIAGWHLHAAGDIMPMWSLQGGVYVLQVI